MSEGYLLLEDGARFDGCPAAHAGPVTGEVVFNTAMTGYQESVTDPSYAGQIIVFTYPLIGNYGVSAAAMESDRIHARGVVMRDPKNGEDVATAEGGWLDWLADCGVPGDRRRRHPRRRPSHPRPRLDARRHLPGGDARDRGARAGCRRALDGRRRPGSHGHPAGAGSLRGRRARTWSGSTPGSSSTSCASCASAAAR